MRVKFQRTAVLHFFEAMSENIFVNSMENYCQNEVENLEKPLPFIGNRAIKNVHFVNIENLSC